MKNKLNSLAFIDIIRAKLKVSIGVIMVSLTEKGEPYYNGLN